jgi:Zn-dependent peptidase ImmA (M78 family)
MAVPMESSVSGRIIRRLGGAAGFHIEINGAHPLARQRFTLAHEISHYLLHRELIGDGIEDTALYRSRLSDDREIEANRLAAQILMPAQLVRDVYRAGLKFVAGLSAAFQVSDAAMRIRLKQLRLAP